MSETEEVSRAITSFLARRPRMTESDKGVGEVSRAMRYRINVTTTSKGVKSYDCTVEGEGHEMAEVLSRSDELVAELDYRYPAPVV